MQQHPFHIRQAEVDDASLVVELVQQLLLELGGFQTFDTPATILLCEQLLSSTHFAAFLAESSDGSPLGVLTLTEAPALYVSGRLGWIQELYVSPAARSFGVGQHLVSAAIQYGRSRQWSRLEVNTPDAEEWPRTVAFYRKEGFIGGSYHLRKFL